MNLLDFFILIPVVWLCIRGFSKGLILELATLIGMALGILAAYYFSPGLSSALKDYLTFSDPILKIISYIAIFLCVLLVSWLIGKLISKGADLIALGWLNKILGGIFGLVKGVLVSALLVMAVIYFDKNEKVITPRAKERSMFYQGLSRVVPDFIIMKRSTDEKENGSVI